MFGTQYTRLKGEYKHIFRYLKVYEEYFISFSIFNCIAMHSNYLLLLIVEEKLLRTHVHFMILKII